MIKIRQTYAYTNMYVSAVGLNSLHGNPIGNLKDFSPSEVLDSPKSVLISFEIEAYDDELNLQYIYIRFHRCTKIHINTFITGFVQNVSPSLYQFFSQNCLHILSMVFKSTTKQPRSGIKLMLILSGLRGTIRTSLIPNFQPCNKHQIVRFDHDLYIHTSPEIEKQTYQYYLKRLHVHSRY